MHPSQQYLEMKFQECVTKTAEKLVELSKSKKRGTLIVGSSNIYIEDFGNELHSCFYLDREQIYGELLEGDFSDKLWGFQIKNFENISDRRYLTSFRLFDWFTGMFKTATGKRFAKEVKEEVARSANLKLTFLKHDTLLEMKIIFSRQ